MTRKNKRKVNKTQNYFVLVLIFISVIAIFLTIYIGYRITISPENLIPINVVAIIAGALLESKRIIKNWTTVLTMALGAYIFSFFAFLPNNKELNYNIENRIEIFPYYFIAIFALLVVCFYEDELTKKLTEGITLIQSIAIIYWVIDYGFVNTNSIYLVLLMIIGLLFSFYSIFQAFTYKVLSRTNRLILSIWSSLVMLLFALDNIYRVYQNEQIENTANIANALYIGLQFFLLGVSSIYIIQNIKMLIEFLPSRGTFFNAEYFSDLKKLKNRHIKRYSNKQVNILHSFYCLLFSVVIFSLNYQYQFLPRHIIIWLVFVTFPIALSFYSYAQNRNKKQIEV